MASEWYALPNGVEVVTRIIYTASEARGPMALAVTASVSLCAVVAILIAMAISGFRTHHQFVRSQVGAYFLSLVLSDLLQASGSVMNIKWVAIQGVSVGPYCTTQAALKQSGNVGTALWSLVIAIHTFCLLFLRVRIRDYVFYAIFVGVWMFIGFIVMMGPLVLQSPSNGPYWGISGYWCWITNGYHVEQLTEEYMFMFFAAGTSFILYSLIFFRLRGNIHGFGWKLKFRRVKQPWKEDAMDQSSMSIAGKQMLWYPVAYTIIVVPIAICRWSAIFGHDVPYWATMASDSIFMLSGFVNAILYSATRKIVSVRAFLPFSNILHMGSSRPFPGRGMNSKSQLDTMEFAIPVSLISNKEGISRSSMSSDTSYEPWSRNTDLVREGNRSQPEVWKINSFSERSDRGKYAEGYTGNWNRQDVPIKIPLTSLRVDHGRALYSFQNDASKLSPSWSRPPTGGLHPGPISTAALSPTSPTTDGAVSPTSPTSGGALSSRRKRFSGWSLPSVRGGRANLRKSLDGKESTRTYLEEMEFAPPSPEPIRRLPLPSPRYPVINSPSPKWPPRSDLLP